MASFPRGIRLFTAPIEATFPYALGAHYPCPEQQVFKALSIEKLYLHFIDGTPMLEWVFPKGMRSFGKGDGKHPQRRYFDSGIRFPLHDPWRCLNFHLSYDIEAHQLDGFVDYLPSAAETKLNYIELEYCLSFTPQEPPHE